MAVNPVASDVEVLYRDLGPRLWRAVLAYCGDPEIASDAVSEAFVQIIARGTEIRSPTAWLWTTVFRIAAGELDHRRTHLPVEITPSYELPLAADHIVSALRKLSSNQRIAIVMHDYADRPTREVAEVLGISTATVHVHLSRGRRKMRALLEEAHD